MNFWSWYAFWLVLVFGVFRLIRRDGARNFLRSLRLWGEGVTPKQRWENLVGLIVLPLLAMVGVLFWLIP